MSSAQIDITRSTPFDIFTSYRGNIECVRDVANKIMDESEVNDLWSNIKTELNEIVEAKMSECLQIIDNSEQNEYV